MESINQENILAEIARVSSFAARLRCEPAVASPTDKITIFIDTENDLTKENYLSLALTTVHDEEIYEIDLDLEKNNTEFIIPENLPEDEYKLELRQDDWIVDSILLEVAEREYAKQVNDFNAGLKLRVQAIDEIKVGNYDQAIELNHQVEKFYERSECIDLAARSWKELGAALLNVNKNQKAKFALERAYSLYKNSNHPQGQAETLLLLGEVVTNEYSVNSALDVYDKARDIADSCDFDLVSLKSRAAIWRLSSGKEGALRRHFYRELVRHSCTVKSHLGRQEAIILHRELGVPELLSQLWSFQHERPTGIIQMVCIIPSSQFSIANRHETLFEDIKFPWDNALEVFTGTLLGQIINTISKVTNRFVKNELLFKITAFRDRDVESFLIGIEQDENRDHILNIIEKLSLVNEDFRFYTQLAEAAGGSLEVSAKSSTDSSIVKMELPLSSQLKRVLGEE